MFVANTTVEQDLALIAQFNAEANENHFNGFDPHPVLTSPGASSTPIGQCYNGPHYINDFGTTS